MSNWIRTEEQLPDHTNDVLAYVQYDDYPIVARYTGKKWRLGSNISDYIAVTGDGGKDDVLWQYPVTHWQELPEKPHN
jgi:hypothetical protein